MFSQTFRRLAQQSSLRFVANQAPMATTQLRDYRTAGSTNRQTRSDYGGQHNTSSRGSSSSGGNYQGSDGLTGGGSMGGGSMGGGSTGRGSTGRGSTGGRTQTTSSGQSRGGSRSTSTTSTGSRGTRGTSGMAIPSMSATTININTSPFSGVREEDAGRGTSGNQQRRRMSTNRGYSKERSGEHLESQQQGRQGSTTSSGSSSGFGSGSGSGSGSGRGSSQFGQTSGVSSSSSQSVNNQGRSGSGATPSGSSDNVGSSGSFTSQSRSSNFPSSVDKPNANPFDAQGGSMNERAHYQRGNHSSTSSGYSQQRQGIDQSVISNTEDVTTHPQGVDHSQRGAGNRMDGSGRQGSGYSQQNYHPQGVSQGQSIDDQSSTSGRAGQDQTFKRDSFQQQDQNQRGSQFRQPNSGRQNQGR